MCAWKVETMASTPEQYGNHHPIRIRSTPVWTTWRREMSTSLGCLSECLNLTSRLTLSSRSCLGGPKELAVHIRLLQGPRARPQPWFLSQALAWAPTTWLGAGLQMSWGIYLPRPSFWYFPSPAWHTPTFTAFPSFGQVCTCDSPTLFACPTPRCSPSAYVL